MKKKLLVLLIAVIPSLMPNLASAVAIDVGDIYYPVICGGHCSPDSDWNFYPGTAS